MGATGVPYRLAIERGKIREFASATKGADASYWKDEAPVIPPTFLVSRSPQWTCRSRGTSPGPTLVVKSTIPAAEVPPPVNPACTMS